MSEKRPIRITVVCGFQLLRTGFRMLFEANSSFEVVGEAADFNQALTNIDKEKPHIILLDLSGDSEFDLPLFPSFALENTHLIILTNSNNLELNRKCLEIGARGSLSKDNGTVALFKAVKEVHRGEFWFDRSVITQTLKRLFAEKKAFYENPETIKIASLTEREKDVLVLVGQGLNNNDIAARLFISRNTVRHHLGSIFEKLNVCSKLELVVYAFKHNLVRPQQQQHRLDRPASAAVMTAN